MFLSPAVFSWFINVSVKLLPHLPTSQIVFIRGLFSFFFCYFWLKHLGVSPWGKRKGVLILRGLFGSLALLCFFYSLQTVPLAIATTLINLTPVFTVLIAHIFLRERALPLQWFFLLCAFFGVFLVRQGPMGNISLIDFAIGLGAALAAAIAYTCIRILRHSENPFVVILYFPLVTTPLVGPYALYYWQQPQGWDWLLLIAIGVLTQVAQYFMTLAYQMEQASKTMIYNYSGLIFSVIIGYGFFAEVLGINQIAGISIVFICLVANLFVSDKAPKKVEPQ